MLKKAAKTGLILAALALAAAALLALYYYPPVKSLGRGIIGVRANLLTGEVSEWRAGWPAGRCMEAADAQPALSLPSLTRISKCFTWRGSSSRYSASFGRWRGFSMSSPA